MHLSGYELRVFVSEEEPRSFFKHTSLDHADECFCSSSFKQPCLCGRPVSKRPRVPATYGRVSPAFLFTQLIVATRTLFGCLGALSWKIALSREANPF